MRVLVHAMLHDFLEHNMRIRVDYRSGERCTGYAVREWLSFAQLEH